MRRLAPHVLAVVALGFLSTAALPFGDDFSGWGLHVVDDGSDGGGDVLTGPYYFRYDMSDANGNGDNNAGWTTLDVLTAPGVGTKNVQPSPLSTASQDLTLGLERGTPQFITPCSATGLACLRFDSGDAAKTTTVATTEWGDFFVDLQPKTCLMARLNASSDNRLYQLFTTKTNTTANGVYLLYDDRAATPSHLQGHMQTVSPTATTNAVAANSSSPTGFAVSGFRLDDVAESLDVFEDGVEVATSSTATLNPQAAAQLGYLGIGTPYITGTTIVGDLYEFICWPGALTDEDILAKSEALAAKWGP